MPRKKQPKTPQSFKLRTDIVEKLDSYAEETGVPKTFVIERAVEEYFERRERQNRMESGWFDERGRS